MNSANDKVLEDMFGSDDDDEDNSINLNQLKIISSTELYSTTSNSKHSIIKNQLSEIGGGYGVFATRDLDVGCLISYEKAFVTWDSNTNFTDIYNLSNIIIDIITSNENIIKSRSLHPRSIELCESSEIKELSDLFNNYDKTILQELSVRYDTPINEILRIGLVIQHNGFHSGLYEQQSLLNHSCQPNCIKLTSSIQTQHHHPSEIWTIEPIKQGEELTICYYHPMESSILHIKQYLQKNHRFSCYCKKCKLCITNDHIIVNKDDTSDNNSYDNDVSNNDNVMNDNKLTIDMKYLEFELHLEEELQEIESIIQQCYDDSISKHECISVIEEQLVKISIYKDNYKISNTIVSCTDKDILLDNNNNNNNNHHPYMISILMKSRICKIEHYIIITCIQFLEEINKKIPQSIAESFLKCCLDLYYIQIQYLNKKHPNIALTLDDLSNAIISLKTYYPNSFNHRFKDYQWNNLLIQPESYNNNHNNNNNQNNLLLALRLSNNCIKESKSIKSIYNSILKYPDTIKILKSTPGSNYWG